MPLQRSSAAPDTPGTHHAAAEPQHRISRNRRFRQFFAAARHDALEIIYILEGSSIVTLSDRTKTVLPVNFC